ncbi:hypothetical protein LENED_002058 [Lentinula edodes]|uniref:Uncharacterized protein n=1 Tax=Lentinula edodes TaxID=5353 RepID=A0A1Q3E048_LENED|nr:hypothetical protein LENED_002058 [Lentinula edodes]
MLLLIGLGSSSHLQIWRESRIETKAEPERRSCDVNDGVDTEESDDKLGAKGVGMGEDMTGFPSASDFNEDADRLEKRSCNEGFLIRRALGEEGAEFVGEGLPRERLGADIRGDTGVTGTSADERNHPQQSQLRTVKLEEKRRLMPRIMSLHQFPEPPLYHWCLDEPTGDGSSCSQMSSASQRTFNSGGFILRLGQNTNNRLFNGILIPVFDGQLTNKRLQDIQKRTRWWS